MDQNSDELMEDLVVIPDVPMDQLTRPLSNGVTYIKTVFEYGEMPTNGGRLLTDIKAWRLHQELTDVYRKKREKQEPFITLMYLKP